MRNYADCLLGPNRPVGADSGFNVFCDKLIEEQAGAVNTSAVNLGQNEAERLRDLVLVVKLDA